MSNEWAYKLGYAAAVVSTYYIGGYGGAMYQSYYSYVATGSTTEALKVGIVAAAKQYAINLWSTGSGFEMSSGGGALMASPNGAGAIGPNLYGMLLTTYLGAPSPPAPHRKTMSADEVGEFRGIVNGLLQRVSSIQTEQEWKAFNPGFFGSREGDTYSWEDAKFVMSNDLHRLSLMVDLTLMGSFTLAAGGSGAKWASGKALPKGTAWVLKTDRGIRYEFYYEIYPMKVDFWMIDRHTNIMYRFENQYAR